MLQSNYQAIDLARRLEKGSLQKSMIKNNFLSKFSIYHHLNQSATKNISPFRETETGLLFYKDDCLKPQFLNLSSQIALFGEAVLVDHYVLVFPDDRSLQNYADTLVKIGAKITEGPGHWPDEFCPDIEAELLANLSMYFLSALMPSGVILVLIAPNHPQDPLARLLEERGPNAVHHVAIRVDDVDRAVKTWQEKGFIPLSKTPQNDGSLCQWFLSNSAGQIIELIARQKEGLETFSCDNITGLRLSELKNSSV